jgi:hypothetical protein
MEASSPSGRHHELCYVLIYYVLEGKEKRQKEKDRQKERERKRFKFLFKSVIYSILFFYSFD